MLEGVRPPEEVVRDLFAWAGPGAWFAAHSGEFEAALLLAAGGPAGEDDSLMLSTLQWARSAGLDIFEEEPAVHPGLRRCERALLAPHIGSPSAPPRARMAAMAAENIIAVLRGEAPKNPVHPAT